ncbi:hypothetical protein [uncultured Bacteroides sp.]|uniref:hypothetical protein n=1 Tax=uncultured Bacteroides sp. TaxID=162156 RepID=UPI002AABBDA1|nr:hypothetical protein [uncultured Bacteroides sp.]
MGIFWYLFFSFGLNQKKQKFKAAYSPLLRSAVPLKGLKLASLKQSPLLNAPLCLFALRYEYEAGLLSFARSLGFAIAIPLPLPLLRSAWGWLGFAIAIPLLGFAFASLGIKTPACFF